jgi:DNA mismatch endonuclease (patch repair protein)
MSRIGNKDTAPEIAVRRVLHDLGYRFRLHRDTLAGRPDVVLPKYRTAIFVHGCFWHGHGRCRKGIRRPSTHRRFWNRKIDGNKARDLKVRRALRSQGWKVITVWECQTEDLQALERRLRLAL